MIAGDASNIKHNTMRKLNIIYLLLFVITFLFANTSNAQTEICLGDDAVVCANTGATVQISVCSDSNGTGDD